MRIDRASIATQLAKEYAARPGGVDRFEEPGAWSEMAMELKAKFQNVPGFVPVIINMYPIKNLPDFLGIV